MARDLSICGWAAVAAVFARRPHAVKRLFFDPPTARRAGDWARWMARERRVYRQVPPEELEKIAGTLHHGGVVAVVERPTLREPTAAQVREWSRDGQPLLVLDRVGNAHNLGALARSAAFFGWKRMVVSGAAEQAQPGEAAYRVAEGGLEHVELWRAETLSDWLRSVRADFLTVGTSLRGPPLDPAALTSAKKTPPRPIALVLGNEEHGLSGPVESACQFLARLPGAGTVESLNVSVAGAVFMWALRPPPPGGARTAPGRPFEVVE